MENKSKFKRFEKTFAFCWKAGVILLGAVIAVCVMTEVVDWALHLSGLKHYEWLDETLGENIEVRYFSDQTCATYNAVTGKRLSPRMKWVSSVPERDSLTVFCDKDDKRGYLNVNTGKIVIDGQYKHSWHFSEGLAAVVADNGKVGFINYDNEMVIPAVYDYVADCDYIFKGGVCVIPDSLTNKYGAIDMKGELKLPMEYSSVFKAYDESTWYIRKDGKCGLADSEMNIIFEPVYDNVEVNPLDSAAYLTLGGLKQLVSFDGEVLLPFVIDFTWPLKYMVKYHDDTVDEYEIHPFLVEVKVDHEYGVMNSITGKMVVPAIYSDIKMISKDLLMAEIDGDEEVNVVFNAYGKMIED